MAEPVAAPSVVDVDEETRWRQLMRMTGAAGLAVFLLTVAWIGTSSFSPADEPAFDGDAAAVLAFFRGSASTISNISSRA